MKLDALLKDFENSQVEDIVKIVKSYSRSSAKRIIEALEDEDPELAYEVTMRLFVFSDILTLDERDIQKIIVKVKHELPKALNTADAAVKEKVLKYLPKLNIENVSPQESEKAQGRIIDRIKYMNNVGEIVIPHDGTMEL
jgi:flagellar motor switch protein FliG